MNVSYRRCILLFISSGTKRAFNKIFVSIHMAYSIVLKKGAILVLPIDISKIFFNASTVNLLTCELDFLDSSTDLSMDTDTVPYDNMPTNVCRNSVKSMMINYFLSTLML